MHPDVLNSWKEIADYLGRGVRTAQRWEAELHLPVSRPRIHKRSAVIALKSDLDQWILPARLAMACKRQTVHWRNFPMWLKLKRL